MGVRIDAPGRVMVDYQTAQEVIRANGSSGGTVQSWRYYLSDARFLVGLESDDLAWLRQLDGALRNPVYPLFLGRKSYVPSLPIALPHSGVLAGQELEDALKNQAWRYCRPAEARSTHSLRLRLESDDHEAGSASNDYPLDFARRRFRPRVVVEREPIIPLAEQIQKDELCISPN
jgi:CRISPR system Cascade subunit CasD